SSINTWSPRITITVNVLPVAVVVEIVQTWQVGIDILIAHISFIRVEVIRIVQISVVIRVAAIVVVRILITVVIVQLVTGVSSINSRKHSSGGRLTGQCQYLPFA